jgi:hypothetical protein
MRIQKWFDIFRRIQFSCVLGGRPGEPPPPWRPTGRPRARSFSPPSHPPGIDKICILGWFVGLIGIINLFQFWEFLWGGLSGCHYGGVRGYTLMTGLLALYLQRCMYGEWRPKDSCLITPKTGARGTYLHQTGSNRFQRVPTCPNGSQRVPTCPNRSHIEVCFMFLDFFANFLFKVSYIIIINKSMLFQAFQLLDMITTRT